MLMVDEFRDGLPHKVANPPKITPLMNIDYIILHDTSHPSI